MCMCVEELRPFIKADEVEINKVQNFGECNFYHVKNVLNYKIYSNKVLFITLPTVIS